MNLGLIKYKMNKYSLHHEQQVRTQESRHDCLTACTWLKLGEGEVIQLRLTLGDW